MTENNHTQTDMTLEHHGGTILQPEAHFPGISPETVFDFGFFKIANSTMMLILAVCVVLVITFFVRRLKSEVPGRLQNLVEYIYEILEGFFGGLLGDHNLAKKVLPVLGSIIIFIMLSNFMGHIPVLTSITYNGSPLFRSATADFNTTFALAVGAVLAIQFIGFKENGIGYLNHFFKFKTVYNGFKKSIGDGFISIVEFFVGILEFIGEFIRVVSLSVRLFGNMFAGEVVMAIIISSFAYFIPAIWLGFEFLVAFVQALVFTSLVTVYYSMVLKKDDH